MDFTVTIAERYAVLPFEILKQEKDDVILLINYYVEKADRPEAQQQPASEAQKPAGIKRIKVNDRTASGGWY